MSAKLKYYYDLMSQPSRAVYMFLKHNRIPFEEKRVLLANGEHQKEAYTKINPFQKVPAIDDNGFTLTESVAIVQYLCKKFKIPENWYPQNDLQGQARVNEYLHWQHTNTRMYGGPIFQNKLFIPRMTKKPIDWKQVELYKEGMKKVVEHIDENFLRNKPYLCGDDISVADVFGVCDMMQLNAVHEESLYESNPNVKAWVERVKCRLGPDFDSAHEVVYKVRDMYKTVLAPQLAKL